MLNNLKENDFSRIRRTNANERFPPQTSDDPFKGQGHAIITKCSPNYKLRVIKVTTDFHHHNNQQLPKLKQKKNKFDIFIATIRIPDSRWISTSN